MIIPDCTCARMHKRRRYRVADGKSDLAWELDAHLRIMLLGQSSSLREKEVWCLESMMLVIRQLHRPVVQGAWPCLVQGHD